MEPNTKKDPSDLLSIIYDKTFPLVANSLSLIVGGSGSGKSFFCYNILTPIYLDNFGIKNVIFCSKTAKCDNTFLQSFKQLEQDYPTVNFQFLSLKEAPQEIEHIRANALKYEFISHCINLIGYEPLKRFIELNVQKKIEHLDQFHDLQKELYEFMDDFNYLFDINNYRVIYTNDSDSNLDEESTDEFDSSDEINYISKDNPIGLGLNLENLQKIKPKIYIEYENEIPYEIYKFINNILVKLIKLSVFGNSSHQPILLIIDDNAGNTELCNQNSDLTKLIYIRRHLHLTIFILSQSTIAINTNIRRNVNSFHLLPSLSISDLKLIHNRLPVSIKLNDFIERYNRNTKNPDRNQQITHLFCVHPYHKCIDGSPLSIIDYYNDNQ